LPTKSTRAPQPLDLTSDLTRTRNTPPILMGQGSRRRINSPSFRRRGPDGHRRSRQHNPTRLPMGRGRAAHRNTGRVSAAWIGRDHRLRLGVVGPRYDVVYVSRTYRVKEQRRSPTLPCCEPAARNCVGLAATAHSSLAARNRACGSAPGAGFKFRQEHAHLLGTGQKSFR
jgi:hypothetical protein